VLDWQAKMDCFAALAMTADQKQQLAPSTRKNGLLRYARNGGF